MQKFFLLTSEIDHRKRFFQTFHQLFDDADKVRTAMAVEVETAAEAFADTEGERWTDSDSCQEWRDDEGYGYMITIQELYLNL